MSQSPKHGSDSTTTITSDELTSILSTINSELKIHAPLHVLLHLGVDTFLDIKYHSVAGETDEQALSRFIGTVKEIKTHHPQFKWPQALTSKNLSLKTLKKYCVLLILCLTVGTDITNKIDSDQYKVNTMFQNEFKSKIRTSDLLTQCLVSYVHLQFQDMQFRTIFDQITAQITATWTSDNKRFHQLNDKLKNSMSSIKDNKDITRDISLFNLLPSLHVIYH